MIFDEDIIEERYDTRKLPSMIPSHHHNAIIKQKTKEIEVNQKDDDFDIENQNTVFEKQMVQSETKIDTLNSPESKNSELYHTNNTEIEEISPFANMAYQQIHPPFSSFRSKCYDEIDSNKVELLLNRRDKYAQGVRSFRVNQNILQSTNLSQSQPLINCANCSHKHCVEPSLEKNQSQRDSDQQHLITVRNSLLNQDTLLEKLRICTSQENQLPLIQLQSRVFSNPQINTNLQCQCSCHNNLSQIQLQNQNSYQQQRKDSNQSASGSRSQPFFKKFHSSIIDCSQFGHNSPTHQIKENNFNHTSIKRTTTINIDANKYNKQKRYNYTRAKSMAENTDNPEYRKKWALTKVIQMSFDPQLTHTLIQSIDYFNLTKEQILDKMIDKLIKFKKYRQQQQSQNGLIIQPNITHREFLKQQESLRSQRDSLKHEQIYGTPNHVLKISQFFNNNINNSNTFDDMSGSISKAQDYTRPNQISITHHRNNSQSSNPQETQNRQFYGSDNLRCSISPTKNRNSFVMPVQKRPPPKYNFSSIKLTQSNQALFSERQKIKNKSLSYSQKIRQETKQGVCSVCFEEQIIIQISSRCSHYFCSYCITNYFEGKIAKCDVLEINCLNFQCPNKYTEREVQDSVDPNTFQQYLKFKRLIMIRNDQTLRWCNLIDCTGVLKGSVINPKMQCETCQSYQCYICSGAWHEGIRCDQAINEEYEKEQIELRKNCPKCLKEVKKSENNINKSTCKACGHRFCWLCNRKVTPFHFSTWNFFGCPGMININQIPSYYQKMKYKIKALFEYIIQVIILTILLFLYPIVMIIVSIFLPLLIFFNKNSGTVKYRGTKKCLVVSGLIFIGIILYPIWYIISIVPGACWFYKKLIQYLRNQKDTQKHEESIDEIEEDYDILSQQGTKGNNESGLTRPL